MTEEYLRQLKLDAESGNLTDMLALIAEIERLRDENRRLRRFWQEIPIAWPGRPSADDITTP